MPPTPPSGLRKPRNPAAANDGDEFHFCTTCAFSRICLPQGYAKPELAAISVLIEHVGPFKPGEYIFREGDAFNAIAAVRGGTVKTFIDAAAGNEQVLGFHLPGEVIGLNAIHPERYPCNAIALDTVTLCRFSFHQLSLLATRKPDLQQLLFKLLSLDIGKASLLTGDHTADERLAAFMVLLSRRYAARGFSATRFTLTMARADIANYLRLAPETISRILKRFSTEQLIEIQQRDVHLVDLDRLEAIAKPVLRN